MQLRLKCIVEVLTLYSRLILLQLSLFPIEGIEITGIHKYLLDQKLHLIALLPIQRVDYLSLTKLPKFSSAVTMLTLVLLFWKTKGKKMHFDKNLKSKPTPPVYLNKSKSITINLTSEGWLFYTNELYA